MTDSAVISGRAAQIVRIVDTWTYTRFTCNATSRLITVDFVNDVGAFVLQRQLNFTDNNATLVGAAAAAAGAAWRVVVGVSVLALASHF